MAVTLRKFNDKSTLDKLLRDENRSLAVRLHLDRTYGQDASRTMWKALRRNSLSALYVLTYAESKAR